MPGKDYNSQTTYSLDTKTDVQTQKVKLTKEGHYFGLFLNPLAKAWHKSTDDKQFKELYLKYCTLEETQKVLTQFAKQKKIKVQLNPAILRILLSNAYWLHQFDMRRDTAFEEFLRGYAQYFGGDTRNFIINIFKKNNNPIMGNLEQLNICDFASSVNPFDLIEIKKNAPLLIGEKKLEITGSTTELTDNKERKITIEKTQNVLHTLNNGSFVKDNYFLEAVEFRDPIKNMKNKLDERIEFFDQLIAFLEGLANDNLELKETIQQLINDEEILKFGKRLEPELNPVKPEVNPSVPATVRQKHDFNIKFTPDFVSNPLTHSDQPAVQENISNELKTKLERVLQNINNNLMDNNLMDNQIQLAKELEKKLYLFDPLSIEIDEIRQPSKLQLDIAYNYEYLINIVRRDRLIRFLSKIRKQIVTEEQIVLFNLLSDIHIHDFKNAFDNHLSFYYDLYQYKTDTENLFSFKNRMTYYYYEETIKTAVQFAKNKELNSEELKNNKAKKFLFAYIFRRIEGKMLELLSLHYKLLKLPSSDETKEIDSLLTKIERLYGILASLGQAIIINGNFEKSDNFSDHFFRKDSATSIDKYLIDKANNYFKILELDKDQATLINIRKAYCKLALKYHPDKNKSANSTAKFQEISTAYTFLTKNWEKISEIKTTNTTADPNQNNPDVIITQSKEDTAKKTLEKIINNFFNHEWQIRHYGGSKISNPLNSDGPPKLLPKKAKEIVLIFIKAQQFQITWVNALEKTHKILNDNSSQNMQNNSSRLFNHRTDDTQKMYDNALNMTVNHRV